MAGESSSGIALKALYAEAAAFYQKERWADAVAVYRKLVALFPNEMRAWGLMGLCASEAGDLAQAANAFRRASELEPQSAHIFFRLGIVSFQLGLADQAEAAFRRVMALDPSNLDAQQNLAAALVDQGKYVQAKPIFESLVKNHPTFELAWAGLANVHRALGDHAGLISALERAVAINPNNVATRHLLIAARGETPTHPDWAYVEQFFDGYASRFETHLVQRLEYQAPEILCAMIRKATQDASPFPRVLDLGCGTGLFGAALRDFTTGDVLVGVDLAQRMLDVAQDRKIYTQLEKTEVSKYMLATPQKFDLVAAADVLIYVGALDEVFAGAARCLVPQGIFAFTVEPYAREGFVLQASGRYAHSLSYLQALASANNFSIIIQEQAHLRRDRQSYETGLYVVMRKLT